MEVAGGKRGAAGGEEPAASECRSRLRPPGKKLQELDVHRWDSLEEGRVLPLEGLRDPARVEALEEEQGHSVQKRAVNPQAEPVHVKEWESQRHPVLRRESPEARHRLRVGDQSPKRQLDPLAPSGGTRRVEEDRRVLVGWERRRLMARRGRRDQPIMAEERHDHLRGGLGEDGHAIARLDPLRREPARIGRREAVEIREGPRSSLEHDRRLLRPSCDRGEEPIDVRPAHTDPAPRNCSRTRESRASTTQAPASVTRPVSKTYARSASASACGTFCSTRRTVTPCSRIRLKAAKTSLTSSGARPRAGSSKSRRRGRAISPRPIAHICCSPPESVPAFCRERFASCGNIARTASRLRDLSARAERQYAPISRFSRTVIPGQSCRASGMRTRPRATSSYGGFPQMSSPSKRICPCRGAISPQRVFRIVVFPAPLAPISVTTSRSPTSKETSQTACTLS